MLPQALILPLHCARSESSFWAVTEASIRTGGCTSSRASVAGACRGAIDTDAGVPAEWLAALALGKRAGQLASQLVDLRRELGSKL